MLTFQNITLRRGPRVLLENVSLTIQPGERWGIVGRNGSGKSSLLALVLGTRDSAGLHPDQGDISLSPQLALAHVAQETPGVTRPALEYVMDGDAELRALQRSLAQAETADDGQQQANLYAQLETIGAYTAPARASRLLNGLGFSETQMQRPVAEFSGGWRMRLNLAQALMCRSDLLLLDEPTNHLDLDAVLWLQDWLRAYRGTALLISHDRDFLDACVDHVALLAQQRIHTFTGNYSDYERQYAAQLAQQQAAFRKQQRSIAHMHSFVERFGAKASKARQAQSRLKALARMEEIAPAHVDSPFEFEFKPPQEIPHPLLKLLDATLGYGADSAILSGVNINLLPGDRIGLLGPNGAGKSTLVKTLAGDLTPLGGNLEAAKALRIGYFAQHQLEQLHGESSPLQHLQHLDRRASEQELRNYLGGFGFVGDQALDPVAPFSGGEKARLVLAMVVYQRPNLLLLDEPTNHLDLEMRHALNIALQGFEGALLIVSHDRHLLRTVCDRFLLVANGKADQFDGDIDDYAQWLSVHRRQAEAPRNTAPATSSNASTTSIDKKQKRQQDAERRKQLQPYREKVAKWEKTLADLQAKHAAVESQLADSSIYNPENKARLTELLAQQAILKRDIDKAESEWISSAEKLENAEQET